MVDFEKKKPNVNINENNVYFQKSEIQENIERQDQDPGNELSDHEDRVQKGYSGVQLKDNFMSDTDFDNCKGQKSGKGQGLYKVEGNESGEIEVHRGQGQDEVKGHDLDISEVMPPDGNSRENGANDEGPMGEKIVKIEPVEVSRGLRQGVFEVLENFKYDEKCSHCKTAVQSDTSTVSSESENEGCVNERSPTLKCVYCSRRFSKRQNFKTHSCVVNREKVPTEKFSCQHCSACFLDINDLKMHLATVYELSGYLCSFCTCKFCDSETLNRHLSVEHGELTVACYLCDARFDQRADLVRHVSEMHSPEKDPENPPGNLPAMPDIQNVKSEMQDYPSENFGMGCTSVKDTGYVKENLPVTSTVKENGPEMPEEKETPDVKDISGNFGHGAFVNVSPTTGATVRRSLRNIKVIPIEESPNQIDAERREAISNGIKKGINVIKDVINTPKKTFEGSLNSTKDVAGGGFAKVQNMKGNLDHGPNNAPSAGVDFELNCTPQECGAGCPYSTSTMPSSGLFGEELNKHSTAGRKRKMSDASTQTEEAKIQFKLEPQPIGCELPPGVGIKCERCSLRFPGADEMDGHICNLHSPEKFVCVSCGEKFRKLNLLKCHMRTVCKQHTCAVCDLGFMRRFSLEDHVAIVHEGKVFRCELCDYESTSRGKFQCHQKTHNMSNDDS